MKAAWFGGDDGTYFDNAGIPLVAYGSGNDTHHKANEYVSIKELKMIKKELVELLEGF
jgi:acetylornithine deacetylase/succinyl-diaminopimelate desuccinylase-like protein